MTRRIASFVFGGIGLTVIGCGTQGELESPQELRMWADEVASGTGGWEGTGASQTSGWEGTGASSTGGWEGTGASQTGGWEGTGTSQTGGWEGTGTSQTGGWEGTGTSQTGGWEGTDDATTGDIDICEELESCEGGGNCIPRNLYGQIAAGEYYNECRNYCFADDHCFDRATAMLGSLNDACVPDLRGPDGKWCGELVPPDSTGTCDDLVYKVIIRYPAGDDWTYHIATVVKTCENGLCSIDPIGAAGTSPTTTCRTPAEWCTAWAHGHTVEWHDTNDKPPAGKVYCEIAPGNQKYWSDSSVADPTDGTTVTNVCKDLSTHVAGLCARGKTPFPAGCGTDSDGDGIPDKWDKCPNSAPGADVDYCDPARLGCAEGETPPGGGGTTSGGESDGGESDGGAESDGGGTTGDPDDGGWTTGGPSGTDSYGGQTDDGGWTTGGPSGTDSYGSQTDDGGSTSFGTGDAVANPVPFAMPAW